MKQYNVFVDGSYIKTSAVGGWSFIICDKDFNIIHKDFGKIRNGVQNSIRAELEAVNMCLNHIKTLNKKSKFTIYCDYKNLVEAVNGFSQRKTNRDIWDMIEKSCGELNGRIKMVHILGHGKNKNPIYNDLNKIADKYARAGVNSLLKTPVKF